MTSFKSVALAVVIGSGLLTLVYFWGGDAGPDSALIRSAAETEIIRHAPGSRVTRTTFIRAGSFVPAAHGQVPKGTAFFPVRVDVRFTTASGDNREETKTFYFYKNSPGPWAHEINSF